jgi:dTDP-4-dehydrorhamnose 3,5-epimerase
MFKTGDIDGIIVVPLKKYSDQRGWLTELFRQDELDRSNFPVMGYISMTNAGFTRGPHEHLDQTDLFGFIGPSNFKIYMWDNRKHSLTFGNKQVITAGEDDPKSVLIPPGVVHAYKNIGSVIGMVTNFPNRLYAGDGKKNKVDEIRHEDSLNTDFKID